MSVREYHAAELRTKVAEAVGELHLVWDGSRGMEPVEFKTAEDAAVEKVGEALGVLEWFAGLSDADAELEYDPTPDTQEQVTTPRRAAR